jgi:glucan phosphorylase
MTDDLDAVALTLVADGKGIRYPVAGRPSSLIGIPFDRPVVGYGGKTIDTLRLWAAAAPDYFNFQEFSSDDFVGALAGTLVILNVACSGKLSSDHTIAQYDTEIWQAKPCSVS